MFAGSNPFGVFKSDADKDPWSKPKRHAKKKTRTRKVKQSQIVEGQFSPTRGGKSEAVVKLEKQLKNLRKKIRKIDNLEARQCLGTKLNKDQLQKIKGKEKLKKEYEAMEKKLLSQKPQVEGQVGGQLGGQSKQKSGKLTRGERKRRHNDPERRAQKIAEEKRRKQELDFKNLLDKKKEHDERQVKYLKEQQQKQLAKYNKKNKIQEPTKNKKKAVYNAAAERPKPASLNTLTKCQNRMKRLKVHEQRLVKIERDFSLGLTLKKEDMALFDDQHEIKAEIKQLQKKMKQMVHKGQITAKEKKDLVGTVEKKMKKIEIIEQKKANDQKLSSNEKKTLKRKEKLLDDWVTLQRTVPMDIKDIQLCYASETEDSPEAQSPKTHPPTQKSGSDLVKNWQNKKVLKSNVTYSKQAYELYQMKEELRYVEDMERKWQQGRMVLSPKQLGRITNKKQLINRIKDLSL